MVLIWDLVLEIWNLRFEFMEFSYTVFDSANKIKKGVTEAANLKEATKFLIDHGWFIKKIKPKGKGLGSLFGFGFGHVPLMERVLFVKHVGIMLKSGISFTEALEVISDQATSKRFKRIVSQVAERVKSGQSLSAALAKYPRTFDRLFINIIRVGEESGTLEENLQNLADELEDRLELRRKIQAASFYPAIVLASTFGLGLILAYFVLPKIKKLFESLSFELPLTTQILIWVADVMDKWGQYILLGTVVGVIFLWFLLTRKSVRPYWHWFLLKMPIIRGILINYNLTMINRTLGIMLKSGLTIDQAVLITSQTIKNSVYRKRLKKVLPQIQRGKKISDILAGFKESKRNPLFPLLMIKMIDIGERSGRLDESLSYLAEYFGKEVDNTTKNLGTILEPALLIFVGLIVGFIAISVISPIYQVTARFRG